jgi:NhaP-type Na+/H+ or K+/H+ antiporter
MIFTGVLLKGMGLIDQSLLGISSELRRMALIIILARAGLSLNIEDLKRVGRPVALMCFLPACCEMLGMILLAPVFLGVSRGEAALIGAVVAAVSPAVIVPKMLKLMEEGYGTVKGIPQLILAGASVDDVFVIVVFYTVLSLMRGDGVSVISFVNIPVSVVLGCVIGGAIGAVLARLFAKSDMRTAAKTIALLCVGFILVSVEDRLTLKITFSGLIAVMAMGVMLAKKSPEIAESLSSQLNNMWVGAEIMLFALVGAAVDLKYAFQAGIGAILLIFAVLVFRMIGVAVCLVKTELNFKERLFCMLAYIPKATVQAAIGAIPLAMGLECGNIVLTVAVLAILVTAPLSAFLMDISYKKLLSK